MVSLIEKRCKCNTRSRAKLRASSPDVVSYGPLEAGTFTSVSRRHDIRPEAPIKNIASARDDLRSIDDARLWIRLRDLHREPKRAISLIDESVVVADSRPPRRAKTRLPWIDMITTHSPRLLSGARLADVLLPKETW